MLLTLLLNLAGPVIPGPGLAQIWPGTLPTIALRDSYQEGHPADSAIRTSMSAGPAKQRNRYTAAVLPFAVSYEMTSTQVTTFWTFYRTTLGNGALPFDGLPHPRTQETVSLRCDVSKPPQVIPLGWDSYEVRLNLEQMP